MTDTTYVCVHMYVIALLDTNCISRYQSFR